MIDAGNKYYRFSFYRNIGEKEINHLGLTCELDKASERLFIECPPGWNLSIMYAFISRYYKVSSICPAYWETKTKEWNNLDMIWNADNEAMNPENSVDNLVGY